MKSRRDFLTTTSALSGLMLVPDPLIQLFSGTQTTEQMKSDTFAEETRSIIGQYGSWADNLSAHPPILSFRNPGWSNIDSWREEAMAKTEELISAPNLGRETPKVKIKASYSYDGLGIEELQWQLPYGRPTEALLLKPANHKGPLPGIVGLHDHGGNKYFGKRKITKTSDDQHPLMKEHQTHYYSGFAWANELAKRGYAVLVPDTFTFGSRRVFYKDMANIPWGPCRVDDKSDTNPEDPKNIEVYNTWAAEHEHIMSKSLFCGGTTWPGVSFAEDQKALDILCARADVDENRVGCCGLSGGGLRTDYLGGLDHRIKCAVSVGFMSTWRDFLMNKAYTHTWMIYTPLLPKYLDFPEVLGLRVPLPTMVLCDSEDQLYTLPEMKKADNMLKEIFEKAGAKDRYSGKFYPGEHKFDSEMQKDAFDWFDQWLK